MLKISLYHNFCERSSVMAMNHNTFFGMIDRNNRYDGFSTTENMTADKVADFHDRLSLRIRKNTFVVLDNASVHICKLMRELRPIWEKRGLFLFFLPPYTEYCRDALENPQGQMAQTCGLLLHRFPALCNKPCVGYDWI